MEIRTAILKAAELLFARRGFAGTRLEDVGELLGMTRPVLFYYFRDKRALYDAVLEEAFAPLARGVETALLFSKPIPRRLEDAVEAWGDSVAERPTLCRLILRHVADIDALPMRSIYSASDGFVLIAWALFKKGIENDELKPVHADPFHATSAVIGTTVFFVAAMSTLLPAGSYVTPDASQIATHKEEILRSVRRLLGISIAPAGVAGRNIMRGVEAPPA